MSRISLLTMPVDDVYLPVNSEARYGAQTGWPEMALQKLTPCRASASPRPNRCAS